MTLDHSSIFMRKKRLSDVMPALLTKIAGIPTLSANNAILDSMLSDTTISIAIPLPLILASSK